MESALIRLPGNDSICLPALIAGAGQGAARRFLEFFTVNIRPPHTRAAYTPAAVSFLNWCEDRAISELQHVQPVHVAAYIEQLQKTRAAPTVKQHLACIRMLFDWLVTGQVVRSNPAHAVRGPRHSVSKGLRRDNVLLCYVVNRKCRPIWGRVRPLKSTWTLTVGVEAR